MPYSRGDIVLALFPDSNLKTAKRRPVLVVQADHLNTGLPQLVAAMITSNLARAGHNSGVVIKRLSVEGQQAGILHDSVIMTDNLATIREAEIDKGLGTWTPMTSVDTALRTTLGL